MMNKEEVLSTIIEHYKNGSTSALSDYCDRVRCADCPFITEDCNDDIVMAILDRLVKAEEHQKAETNLEHYFNVGDVIVYHGQQIIHLNDNCWDAYDKSKTSHIVRWLLSPYKPPKPKYKLSKFEYDLLKWYCEPFYKITDIWILVQMKSTGYYKDIPHNVSIKDIIDNCEVVEE